MLPAEASGRMRPGDELVDINGNSVEGLNAEEATNLIRQVKYHRFCWRYVRVYPTHVLWIIDGFLGMSCH